MPASDLCPLADVTIEIRAQSQVRSIVSQEVKLCVYYTGGRGHPIDTSSRHPFFESILPSSQVHPGSLSLPHIVKQAWV